MEPHKLPSSLDCSTGEGEVVYLISSAKQRGPYSRCSVELKAHEFVKATAKRDLWVTQPNLSKGKAGLYPQASNGHLC